VKKPLWKRLIRPVLSLIVVVATFAFVLPSVANYRQVWNTVASLSIAWIVLLVLLDAVNIATYGPPWVVALPGLRYFAAEQLTLTSTAVSNVMPAGGALSFGVQYEMLRTWGFPVASIARALVITGLWSQLTNLSLPIIAIFLLTLKGGRNALLETAAKIGAFVLVIALVALFLALRSEAGARWVGRKVDAVANLVRRLFRRTPHTGMDERLVKFRAESLDLLKRRWHIMTLVAYVGALSVYVVLIACLRACGVGPDEVSFTEALAAWSLVNLLTAIPLAPGGLGIVELGLTGALTSFGGHQTGVVAAVLLYRCLTWLVPIALGGIAALTWQHGHHGTKFRGAPAVASADQDTERARP
jgi:putative heme transporter